MAELARPLLSAAPIGVYRDQLVNRLAEEVRLPQERLAQLLQGQQRQPVPRHQVAETQQKNAWDVRAEFLIGRLLHFPQLAADTDSLPKWEYLNEPRVVLFRELYELARRTPRISPAKLVERYRDQPEHDLISQLLAKDTGLNAQQARLELKGGIDRMSSDDNIRKLAARTPA